MKQRSILTLCVTAAASCASATSYIWAQGSGSDFTGFTSYSQYLENVDTTVADQREIFSEVHASFGSSASYGALTSNTEIDALGVQNNAEPSVNGTADTRDSITVGGTGMITLHFSMPVSGFMDPNSQQASVLSTFDAQASTGQEAYCAYQAHVHSGIYSLDQSILTSDITVLAGTQITLFGHLGTNSRLYWLNQGFLKSQADYSHTAHLYVDVLTAGGSITSESGHDYATQAVPEPATLAVLGLGLLLRRRRAAKTPRWGPSRLNGDR